MQPKHMRIEFVGSEFGRIGRHDLPGKVADAARHGREVLVGTGQALRGFDPERTQFIAQFLPLGVDLAAHLGPIVHRQGGDGSGVSFRHSASPEFTYGRDGPFDCRPAGHCSDCKDGSAVRPIGTKPNRLETNTLWGISPGKV